MGIPYVAHYLDPVTSTMGKVSWADHWNLLENSTWIKWIFELALPIGFSLLTIRLLQVAIQDFIAVIRDLRRGK